MVLGYPTFQESLMSIWRESALLQHDIDCPIAKGADVAIRPTVSLLIVALVILGALCDLISNHYDTPVVAMSIMSFIN